MFGDLITNLAASVIYDFGKKILTIADKMEVVQLARKQLGANPTLYDFPGRYVEALVELRFEGKEKVVVDFFRNESIMKTFYDFYYGTPDKAGSTAILDSGIQHFVQSLIEGDDLKAAGVEVKTEVTHFWLTFKQKVQESRTVKEVELQQQIADVAQEVERRRLALLEADREVKVLEKLRERQLTAYEAVQSKREDQRLPCEASAF